MTYAGQWIGHRPAHFAFLFGCGSATTAAPKRSRGLAMNEVNARILHKSDIDRCPKRSIMPGHYRPDGSCYCDEGDALHARIAELRKTIQEADEVARQTKRDAYDEINKIRRRL